ncbi:hypothetical protein D5S17_04575 [Pseudonocardiaceae bacterium YIM PH 21723]|nr:hypothetical protein D5S17_04575 [Pseudonocardiaceae bacterium YIM PH 21723]
MRWYAERPGRFLRQFLSDVLAVAWVYGWVRVALWTREQVLALRDPGQGLVDAGTTLHDTFGGAADKANKVPFVGEALAGALSRGTRAGDRISGAGHSQIDTVTQLGQVVLISLITLAVIVVLATWLPVRLRYARQASAIRTLARSGVGDELLATRALHRLPLNKLAKLAEKGDPATLVREGDQEIVGQLVAIELRTLGLKPAKR